MTPEELKEVKELVNAVLRAYSPDPEEIRAKKKAEILNIKDTIERQKAIEANFDLF